MQVFRHTFAANWLRNGGSIEAFHSWNSDDIRYIIKNDLYIGRLQYAVNVKSQYLRGLEPIYTHREDLRIVSDDIFESNQKIATLRRRIPVRTKVSPHLFSGIMRCPVCAGVMTAKKQRRNWKTKITEDYSYSCARYNRSGPNECPGYWINEREILSVVMPVLIELIQTNLREHLQTSAVANPLHGQIRGELKAGLAQVDQSMRNLLDAVKQGALSMEQIKEENADLLATKHRLEKRIADIDDVTQIEEGIRTILDVFDHDLEEVLSELIENRLRFNTFVRLFFSALVVEVDRPGVNWRKGKKRANFLSAMHA